MRFVLRWRRQALPAAYARPWHRKAAHFAAFSPVMFWTLLRLRRRLERSGLPAAIQEAVSARRHVRRHLAGLSHWDQRMRACHEDDILCWWLLKLDVRALCLYRCLVMLDRMSRLPYLETLEFVIGAQRVDGGLDAHSWLVANGHDFRQDPKDWAGLAVIYRSSINCRDAPQPS